MAKGKISAKQQEILDYIKSEIINRGYPPAVREICEAVHLKSTSSVHSHLETLEKNGYIESYRLKDISMKKRVYYHITKKGIAYYYDKCKEWELTRDVINRFAKEL